MFRDVQRFSEVSEMFRGFQRCSETCRGFQRCSEVFRGFEVKREKPPGNFVMNHHLAERFGQHCWRFLHSGDVVGSLP